MPTETAPTTRHYWPSWVNFLRRHGLESISAWLLEGAGPLALLGAQVYHFGSPLFRPAVSQESAAGLIQMLENDEERSSFILYLREAGKS